MDFVPQLSTDHLEILHKDVDAHEIRRAIFQLGGLKAPGPDGIPAIFYQKAWDIVGSEVSEAVQHFFKSEYLLREWN